jgi:hypothetical protein
MLHIVIAHYDCAAIPNAPLCAADIPIPSLDAALIAVAAVAALGLVRMFRPRSAARHSDTLRSHRRFCAMPRAWPVIRVAPNKSYCSVPLPLLGGQRAANAARITTNHGQREKRALNG